jgi:hypothetical protein
LPSTVIFRERRGFWLQVKRNRELPSGLLYPFWSAACAN